MTPLLNAIVMAGMLLVVPLGLRLVEVSRTAARVWWAGAVPGAASLWIGRGAVAAALAAAYLVAALFLAAQIPSRLRGRTLATWGDAAREVAVATALGAPVVAGIALSAERAGHPLWGFDLGILALTTAHFHYAGFAAALVAGLLCRASADSPLGRAAALAVPAGTLLVLGGYFAGEWAELAGTVVLTAGMWLVAWLTLTWLRREARADRATRALLFVSAAVLAATMLLALSWAFGEATGLPHPPIPWMIATHGLANAAGFALCGIAAWWRLRARPL
ncbi:YndJ family protein [Spongiactinospora sp. TRM90649]|uniref:YndJ family protein n=1 Tax=Spongiactinospora sp. TRM90649 TaxID=3031114 RepID=UPI0023F9E7FD|nr:YndJ family protein [Spongiactinospora sp. TRM90649]MDF5755305.1 YndJ family protein [Spongiactinospora sp. TRM90649]